MKTTIDLDDDLLLEAKRRAASQGVTLRSFVEDALRVFMQPKPPAGSRFKLQLPVVCGRRQPSLDISDRRALYDLMGDRSCRLSPDCAASPPRHRA